MSLSSVSESSCRRYTLRIGFVDKKSSDVGASYSGRISGDDMWNKQLNSLLFHQLQFLPLGDEFDVVVNVDQSHEAVDNDREIVVVYVQ